MAKKLFEFTLITRNEQTGKLLAENYDNRYDPRKPDRASISDIEHARKYCQALVDWFNQTLNPGESPRVFVDCLPGHHAWTINSSPDPEDQYNQLKDL